MLKGTRRRRGGSAIVGGLVTALALAACGGSSSNSGTSSSQKSASGTKAPYVFLTELDTTGPTKLYGAAELEAIKAAAKVINTEGGILGRQIHVVDINDNGDPQTGTSALISYLSSHPAPDAMNAGAESGVQSAEITVAARRHIMTIQAGDGDNMFATDASQKYPLGFQVQGTAAPPNQEIALFFKSHGVKKVGILEGQYAYAQSEVPFLVAELNRLGIPHVTVQASLTSTNLTPQIAELKSDGADGIYVAVTGPSGSTFVSDRAQLGWTPVTVGEGSFSSLDYVKTNRGQLKNLYETFFPPAVSNTTVPGVPQMVKAIGPAVINASQVTLLNFGLGYDVLFLIRDGAKKAGSTDPTAIAKALESGATFTDPDFGLFKSYRYSANDHQNVGPAPSAYPIIPPGPINNGQVQVSH